MSGESFDLERFQELTELEETIEVVTAAVELSPEKKMAERETEQEVAEKSETEKTDVPSETAEKLVVTETIRETVREKLVAVEPEIAALYPKKSFAQQEIGFAAEPEQESAEAPLYRDWSRKWQRERRRYDGGFLLY